MVSKQKTEFVIYESSRRFATVTTRAKAESLIRQMTKKLPMGMGFDFSIVEEPKTPSN